MSLLSLLPLSDTAESLYQDLTRVLIQRHLHAPLRDLALSHLSTGGKRLRARLAFNAAAALNAPESAIAPWAVACDLLHNASLIHDDIQDADHVRRAHPALWTRCGTSQAINTGDALLILPFAALTHSPSPSHLLPHLLECLTRRALLTANGQALEHDLNLSGELRRECGEAWSDYVRVADGKSGQFFALPIEGAALIANLPPDQARHIGDAAARLGILYQILDDLMDLHGALRNDPESNDIRQGRPTALVTLHHTLHPSDAHLLPGCAPSPPTPQAFFDLLHTRGTLTALLQKAYDQELSLVSSPSLLPHTPLHTLLTHIAQRLTHAIQAHCAP